MIVERQILVVNELITAPKNLKIRYNVEEEGFYRFLIISNNIDEARLSLRKNNRLEGIFSLNAYLAESNIDTTDVLATFNQYVDANTNFGGFEKLDIIDKKRKELGIVQLKKGLITGVLLLDVTVNGFDKHFQLILQKVRFKQVLEEEDKAQ